MRRSLMLALSALLLSLIVTDYAEAQRGGRGFGGGGFRGGGGFGGAGFRGGDFGGGGFAQLESAEGDGLSAVSVAPVGERLEVVGVQSQVALAGALQDGVRDGADDGRGIDPAEVIAGLVRRQVSASRALRTTAATIRMTMDIMITAPMAMTIALRCHRAFGMASRTVWCG
jgi:hypothetical protein